MGLCFKKIRALLKWLEDIFATKINTPVERGTLLGNWISSYG